MYQQLTIVGNVGIKPSMRYTPGGQAVTTFSVATHRKWKDKTGQAQERTTWHRCTAWNGLGETVAQYVDAGAKVMVIGTVDTHAWEDGRTGEPRAQLEVRCDTVRFLDSRQDVDQEPDPPQPAIMSEIHANVQKGPAALEHIPF